MLNFINNMKHILIGIIIKLMALVGIHMPVQVNVTVTPTPSVVATVTPNILRRMYTPTPTPIGAKAMPTMTPAVTPTSTPVSTPVATVMPTPVATVMPTPTPVSSPTPQQTPIVTTTPVPQETMTPSPTPEMGTITCHMTGSSSGFIDCHSTYGETKTITGVSFYQINVNREDRQVRVWDVGGNLIFNKVLKNGETGSITGLNIPASGTTRIGNYIVELNGGYLYPEVATWQ